MILKDKRINTILINTNVLSTNLLKMSTGININSLKLEAQDFNKILAITIALSASTAIVSVGSASITDFTILKEIHHLALLAPMNEVIKSVYNSDNMAKTFTNALSSYAQVMTQSLVLTTGIVYVLSALTKAIQNTMYDSVVKSLENNTNRQTSSIVKNALFKEAVKLVGTLFIATIISNSVSKAVESFCMSKFNFDQPFSSKYVDENFVDSLRLQNTVDKRNKKLKLD